MPAKVVYTAHAHVTGGREAGRGRSSDGALAVDLRPPADEGSEPQGTNPEQLFAVGYAACFEGALGAVGRRQRIDVSDASIEAAVSLVTNDRRGFDLVVDLDVTLPEATAPGEAADLVRAADEVCPYSNAIRGNVGVTLRANGEEI